MLLTEKGWDLVIALVKVVSDPAEELVGLKSHHSALRSYWQHNGCRGLSPASPSLPTTTCTM